MPHLLAVTVRVGFIFIIGALGALLSLVALEQTVEKERYQEVAAERKRTTSLLSATLDSTADGILVVDREGRIVAHNDRFRQMWGIPPDLLASGSDEEAIQFVLDQLQDPSAFQKRIAYLYDHPEEESRDLLEFQDGRIFERYSRPQVLDGEIVGRVWSFRDVTEQERTRRALESSNRELEQFAYAASHDLQEPLRMVKGYLDLLERRYGEELDEDAHEFIDYAVDGATRMSELIRGLLQYSRVGRSGGEMEPTPLVEPLHEALAHLQPQIDELDATVDHADLPVALADRTQLTFLLQNLIGNALKFHGDEAPPHVRITASGGDDGWVIAVADNGQGIPEGDQERIFEIFERGTARDVDGAGIGLATCKRIVERHGGEIWVESEVGEGSTFYFTLEDAGNGGSAQDHGSG